MSYRRIDNLSKVNLIVLYLIVLYYSKGLSTFAREVKNAVKTWILLKLTLCIGQSCNTQGLSSTGPEGGSSFFSSAIHIWITISYWNCSSSSLYDVVLTYQ